MVKNWKSTVLAVGFGLLLSLLLASTLFTTSQLARKGINAPASQCLLYYLLMALVNGGIMLYRKKPHKEKLYCYIMLALVDVLANFFVIEAINRTSVTSVMLLSNWTIMCTLLLDWLFLKEKYGVQILIGLAICVASYPIVFVSDVHSVHGSAINLVKGNIIVMVASTLSGVSNLGQAFLKRNDDWVTHNAFLGLFGSILTSLQIVMSERNEFTFILSSPVTIFLVIGFSLSKIFLQVGTPFFYEIDGSEMLNLPIMTAYNIWVILIRIFAYHEKVDWIYFVAVVVTTFGLGLMLFPEESDNDEAPVDEEADLDCSNKNRHKISSVELQNSSYMSWLFTCKSDVNGLAQDVQDLELLIS